MSASLKSEEASKDLRPASNLSHDCDMEDNRVFEEEKTPAPAVMPVFLEGGTKAWLVVLGCWCTSFASFGIVNSFG